MSEILARLLQLVVRKTVRSKQLQDLFFHHISKNTRPTVREFSALLQVESEALSKLFIIADALDECLEKLNYDDWRFKLLFELVKTTTQVTTADRSAARSGYFRRISVSIDICASDDDIRKYVMGRIDMERNLKRFLSRDPLLTEMITMTITEKVKGMVVLLSYYHLLTGKGS